MKAEFLQVFNYFKALRVERFATLAVVMLPDSFRGKLPRRNSSETKQQSDHARRSGPEMKCK